MLVISRVQMPTTTTRDYYDIKIRILFKDYLYPTLHF